MSFNPSTQLLRSIPFCRHPYIHINVRHLSYVSADITVKWQMSAMTDVKGCKLIWVYGCLRIGMDLNNHLKGFKIIENITFNENFQKQKFSWFPLYFLNKIWSIISPNLYVSISKVFVCKILSMIMWTR